MSWVTLVEADAYFLASINRDEWNNSVDDTKKQAALDTAFRQLNLLYSSQVTDPVQDNLKYANYEHAFCLFTNSGMESSNDKQLGIKSKSIGDYSISYSQDSNMTDSLYSYICNAAKFYLQEFEDTRLAANRAQSFILKRQYDTEEIG